MNQKYEKERNLRNKISSILRYIPDKIVETLSRGGIMIIIAILLLILLGSVIIAGVLAVSNNRKIEKIEPTKVVIEEMQLEMITF